MRSWVEFWDSEHAIYVNERHKQLHAEAVGRDLISHILAPDAIVLDHGCGEANYAADVATHCRRLYLCEAAQGVRQALAQRVRAANIEIPFNQVDVNVRDLDGVKRHIAHQLQEQAATEPMRADTPAGNGKRSRAKEN